MADAGWAWPTFTGSTTLLVLLRFTLRDRLKKQVAAAIDRRPRIGLESRGWATNAFAAEAAHLPRASPEERSMSSR